MHKAVLIIGDDIPSQLEPYDEDLLVPPYTEKVDDEEVLGFLEFYLTPEEKVKLSNYSKQEIYEAAHFMYRSKGSDWNNNQWTFNLTIPQVLATHRYNPDGQWDWYDIGGRYTDLLIFKDKTKGCIGNISYLDIEATVNNPDEFISAVIIDSVWFDNGDYSNCEESHYYTLAKQSNCWHDFVGKLLKANLNQKVTVVDLHF